MQAKYIFVLSVIPLWCSILYTRIYVCAPSTDDVFEQDSKTVLLDHVPGERIGDCMVPS